MTLKSQYDKLLHISITFILMCFLCVWLPLWVAALVTAALQAAKVVANWRADEWYLPYGDIAANLLGYGLFWGYAIVR